MRAVSLLLALGSLVPLLSVSCSHPSITQPKPLNAPQFPHPSWNGLSITANSVPTRVPDSVIKSLNIITWEFDIGGIKPNHALWYRVTTERKGQAQRSESSGSLMAPSSSSYNKVYVAAYPLGDSWQKAEKMKIVIGAKEANGESSVAIDRGNILRGSGISGWGTPFQRDDGSFLLAWAERRSSGSCSPQDPHDAALVVQFMTNDGKRPPKW